MARQEIQQRSLSKTSLPSISIEELRANTLLAALKIKPMKGFDFKSFDQSADKNLKLSRGVMIALSTWVEDNASAASEDAAQRLLGHVIKIVNDKVVPRLSYSDVSPGFLAENIRLVSSSVRPLEDEHALNFLADLLITQVRPSVDQQHAPSKQKEFCELLLVAVEKLEGSISQNEGKISNSDLAKAYMYYEAAQMALANEKPKLHLIKMAREEVVRAESGRFFKVIEAPIADFGSNIQGYYLEHKSLENLQISGVGPKTRPKLESLLKAASIRDAIFGTLAPL